ncbi:flagellar biosynthetic protein FliQ [Parvularcula oceani]|uniref:flagellar biosynthetic protein FliQ n=1 Tax=Parvularcula oceani TaxID=1247963 RepID=UPI0004E1DD88|nr:flagellar biosynthetic protein FliQ [Parvularcula oceani]
MTETDILDLLREALGSAALMSLPLLLAALLTGLIIGLLQALTSIQEMTLTFVPKIGVMLLVFWASAGMMVGLVVKLFDDRVLALIAA